MGAKCAACVLPKRYFIYLVKCLHPRDEVSNPIKQLSMGKKQIWILKTQKLVNIIQNNLRLKAMLPYTNNDWPHVGG